MSRVVDTWLLPEGVADVLPAEAARLEALRRRLLDHFAACGYQLVFPPLMEYLESLLTGSGHDLDLMTFKITDQLTGRMMGVRADITPQVARLDAHSLPVDGPARYCYAGTTLNTRPASLAASRCPVQIGAELYGYSGVAGDIEILRLMLDGLAFAGARDVQLELGHVGIFRSLAAQADIHGADETVLFDIYQRKAVAELREFFAERALASGIVERFMSLLKLSGGVSVLADAKAQLSGLSPEIDAALASVIAVADAISESHPNVTLYIDVTELRGYHYHTGLVFAAYVPGPRGLLAKGGRYDDVGQAFGRARPATGFSADLNALLMCVDEVNTSSLIAAPAGESPELRAAIAEWRAKGERVLQALPGEPLSAPRELRLVDGRWQVVSA